MSMRKRILKWQRDRAVARLANNSRNLDILVSDNATIWTENREFQMERLRRRIEDDKDFIRRTAQEAN